MSPTELEEAVVAALRSLPESKQQEVLDFASFLKWRSVSPRPQLSARGLWKDLGISISSEEIAEARREPWRGSPQESSDR